MQNLNHKKSRKRIRTKKVTKEKIVMKMVGINPTISIITLDVHDLNKPIKKQKLPQWIKKNPL